MDFLKEHELAYVCCDEPQGFKSSAPLVFEVTSDIGLVRLHGRNTKTWEKPGISTAEKFNYLYTEGELEDLVPKVKDLASKIPSICMSFSTTAMKTRQWSMPDRRGSCWTEWMGAMVSSGSASEQTLMSHGAGGFPLLVQMNASICSLAGLWHRTGL